MRNDAAKALIEQDPDSSETIVLLPWIRLGYELS